MGKRQDVSHLRVSGAKCWAKIPTVNGAQVSGGSKLDPRSVACYLLGYSLGAGNYRVQDIVTRRVFVSCDVIFEEGRAHRTLAGVGEESQILLFDTLFDSDSPPTTTQPSTNLTPTSMMVPDKMSSNPIIPINVI
jgi:hypothetical protein